MLLAENETTVFPFCVRSRDGFLRRSTKAQVPDSCRHFIPLLGSSWVLMPIYTDFYIGSLGDERMRTTFGLAALYCRVFCPPFSFGKLEKFDYSKGILFHRFLHSVVTTSVNGLCLANFFLSLVAS